MGIWRNQDEQQQQQQQQQQQKQQPKTFSPLVGRREDSRRIKELSAV